MKIDKSDLISLKNLELLAKQVVEGFITGLHKSPFHGFSVEFAEHRLYNKGESTRHIDWKLFARTDKMMVKRYEEETNLRCQVVIDTSGSMYYGDAGWNKMKYSVIAAASLMELMRRQLDAIGLSLFDEQLHLHTPCKSSERHQRYLYTELEKCIQPYSENQHQKSTSSVQALHDIAELCHKRSLVILFTDFLDDPNQIDSLFEAINHLKHNQHEVVVFHVTHDLTERQLDLGNRPHTLVDMETGEKLKIKPGEIKEAYQKMASEYFKEIRLRATNAHIDFVTLHTEDDLEPVLVQYLLKRRKMT